MEIHSNIVQQSTEWYELRWGKVTGSRVSTLLGSKEIKDLALFDEIMGEMCHDLRIDDEGYVSEDMQRGLDLEPHALEELISNYGIEFEKVGFLSNGTYQGHSPDAMTIDCKKGAEIKCPGIKNHNKYCRENTLPKEHIPQVINMFSVNKEMEELYFVSYDPDHKIMPLFVFIVERSTPLTYNRKKFTVSDWVAYLDKRILDLGHAVEEEILMLKARVNNEF